ELVVGRGVVGDHHVRKVADGLIGEIAHDGLRDGDFLHAGLGGLFKESAIVMAHAGVVGGGSRRGGVGGFSRERGGGERRSEYKCTAAEDGGNCGFHTLAS